MRLLTTLHFPSNTGYHRFNYPVYRPVEKLLIESISIRLVTKTGENVLFEDGYVPCFVTLHFKKSPQLNWFSVCQLQWIDIQGTTQIKAVVVR